MVFREDYECSSSCYLSIDKFRAVFANVNSTERITKTRLYFLQYKVKYIN